MSKHTPGPWRVGNLGSYDAHTDEPYRNVWAGEGAEATVVARAVRAAGSMTNDVDEDARLIAAAPDLLAALKALVEDQRDASLPVLIQAREAIDKALGKE